MKIKKINIIVFSLKNKEVFSANYGEFNERQLILIKVLSNDGIGYGVCPTLGPYYSEETISSAINIIKKIIAPRIIDKEIENPKKYNDILKDVRGNYFAKAGIELALWDLFSKKNKTPLYKYIGGVRNEIECGYSLGMINNDIDKVLDTITEKISKGYKRIKIKITPGWDINVVRRIKNKFPNLKLMVDCNGGYKIKDVDIFRELDKYNLEMIEQPLNYRDLYFHSLLQKELNTPICLDESIKSTLDVKTAIALKSCKIINIKPFRVGGISKSIEINKICQKNNISVWNGGMHESGVGAAFNMAVASLSNFNYPADIIPPKELFCYDIITPEIKLTSSGTVKLKEEPGIGFEINRNLLDKAILYTTVIGKTI